MTEKNPFFEISHRGDEYIILTSDNLKKISSLTNELVKKHKVIFVVGEPGAGKTLIEKRMEAKIPKKVKVERFMFTVDLLNELRSIPAERMIKKDVMVFIDKFWMSEAMNDKELKRIVDVMLYTSTGGIGYIVSCHPDTLSRVFALSDEMRKYSRVYHVPPLTFDQTKKLITSRLNLVRKKKSKSLEPFTAYNLKNIWKTSRGNPRMILLLCANLYETLKG